MPYVFNPKGCRLRWRWITRKSIIVEEDEMDVAVMMIWAVFVVVLIALYNQYLKCNL